MQLEFTYISSNKLAEKDFLYSVVSHSDDIASLSELRLQTVICITTTIMIIALTRPVIPTSIQLVDKNKMGCNNTDPTLLPNKLLYIL